MRALSRLCFHDYESHRGALRRAQEDTGSHQDHRQEEGRHLSIAGWRGGVSKEIRRR